VGVQVDASRTPDLVPTIAVELSKMGADIRERPDGPVRARAESCMELTDMAKSAGSSWR
jgi:5-enolpyruvylshikimate-3-phosphate synthase